MEADVTERPRQGEGNGGSAQHGGPADQNAEAGKARVNSHGSRPCPHWDLLDMISIRPLGFLIFLPPQEFHRLQDENVQLKTICEDQEQALEELGSKLSEYVTLLPINVE